MPARRCFVSPEALFYSVDGGVLILDATDGLQGAFHENGEMVRRVLHHILQKNELIEQSELVDLLMSLGALRADDESGSNLRRRMVVEQITVEIQVPPRIAKVL